MNRADLIERFKKILDAHREKDLLTCEETCFCWDVEGVLNEAEADAISEVPKSIHLSGKDLADANSTLLEAHGGRESEDFVILTRGDYREYPDRLWSIARCLRDTFKFVLPEKPSKVNRKSKYSFWILSMDDLAKAGGANVIPIMESLHKEYMAYAQTHGGTWPIEVTGPQSLVKIVTGRAAQMRNAIPETKIKDTRNREDENKQFVPAPERRKP